MRRGALPAREQCAEKIRGPSPPPYPDPSRRPWLGIPAGRARWRSRFPPRRAGGLLRLCRSLRAGDKGSPRRFAPLRPLLASGPSRSPPPALPLGGVGLGFPPVPVARSRRALPPLLRRRVGGSLRSRVRFGGGVSWSLCLAVPASCRSLAWFSVPPGAGLRRGAVPPWACRSAARVVRCPASWRWPGSVLSPPRRASRGLGVGGFPPAPVFARCARSPVGLRFPCRFAGVCRRAGRAFVGCWPLARLSRALPLPVPRVGSRRRGVFRLAPAVAGVRAARGRRRGLGARPWPLGRGRLRGWRRFVRSRRRSRCAGVFRRRVRLRSRCVRRPVGRAGAGCRGWRSRFRLRGVSRCAVPCWLVAFRSVVGLFLRVRVRLLGFRRVRGWSRFAPGRVPLRVFGPSAVGSLGARWFWCLGGRFSVAVISVLIN